MGTKNNPGAYDCYAKLEDDEPYFVLRAKDPTAAAVVRFWVLLNQEEPVIEEDISELLEACEPGLQPEDKLAEASTCADQMTAWFRENFKKFLTP